MKIGEGFDDHCFHIRGYAILSLGARLEKALDAALAGRVLAALRDKAGQAQLPAVLREGERSLTTLGDLWRRSGLAARVGELVAQAETAAGSGAGAGQLLKSIKRRAADWRPGLDAERCAAEALTEAARAIEAAGEGRGNPYVTAMSHREAVERAGQIAREATAGASVADSRTRALEEELSREVERLHRQDERLVQLTQSEERASSLTPTRARPSRFKQWHLPLAIGAVVFILALIMGVGALTAAGVGILLAALTSVIQWRASKALTHTSVEPPAATETAGAMPQRRMTESLREKFLAYGRALEDAAILAGEDVFATQLLRGLEASDSHTCSVTLRTALDEAEGVLKQELSDLPEGFFHEIDPGQVDLFGSNLVNMLAENALPTSGAADFSMHVLSAFTRMEGIGLLGRLQAGDGRAAAQALCAAVAEVRLSLTLDETLAQLERHASGQRFFTHWLDALATGACSALALGQEMRLDPALSVVRLTVGLPAGEVDPLAAIFRQRFPHAGVTLGSLPDAIEFIFDVRNLPAAALMTHELSRSHYEAANLWEREKLWHFPRKVADRDAASRNRSVNDKVDWDSDAVRPFIPLRQAASSNGNGKAPGKIQELIFPGDIN